MVPRNLNVTSVLQISIEGSIYRSICWNIPDWNPMFVKLVENHIGKLFNLINRIWWTFNFSYFIIEDRLHTIFCDTFTKTLGSIFIDFFFPMSFFKLVTHKRNTCTMLSFVWPCKKSLFSAWSVCVSFHAGILNFLSVNINCYIFRCWNWFQVRPLSSFTLSLPSKFETMFKFQRKASIFKKCTEYWIKGYVYLYCQF